MKTYYIMLNSKHAEIPENIQTSESAQEFNLKIEVNRLCFKVI